MGGTARTQEIQWNWAQLIWRRWSVQSLEDVMSEERLGAHHKGVGGHNEFGEIRHDDVCVQSMELSGSQMAVRTSDLQPVGHVWPTICFCE